MTVSDEGRSPFKLPAPKRELPPQPIFRILALSGGGYRGLFAADVLTRLHDRSGSGDFAEEFDLFAGTSIGGLIATGLALGRPPAVIRDAIQTFGPAIFDDSFSFRGRKLPIKKLSGPVGGLFASKFERAELEKAIVHVLGDNADRTIAEVPRPLLVVATCATTRAPFLMSNLAPEAMHGETPLTTALLATAAAPGYFPAVDLQTRSLLDGGLVANAPELVALAEITRLRLTAPDRIEIVSVGTASADAAIPPAAVGKRGLAQWMIGDLVPITLEAQESLIVRQASALLADRYTRIDAKPSPGQAGVLALDKATPEATRTLLHLSEEAVRAFTGDLSRVSRTGT